MDFSGDPGDGCPGGELRQQTKSRITGTISAMAIG
jgi:hypothetical protein